MIAEIVGADARFEQWGERTWVNGRVATGVRGAGGCGGELLLEIGYFRLQLVGGRLVFFAIVVALALESSDLLGGRGRRLLCRAQLLPQVVALGTGLLQLTGRVIKARAQRGGLVGAILRDFPQVIDGLVFCRRVDLALVGL